jgi:hypothetical protein
VWGYVKDRVYVPPLPRDLPELRLRIMDAVATIDVHMLERVWQELDYRIDACQVTKGGHIFKVGKVGSKVGYVLFSLTCSHPPCVI